MKRVVVVAIAVGVLVVGGALAWFYSTGNEAPSTRVDGSADCDIVDERSGRRFRARGNNIGRGHTRGSEQLHNRVCRVDGHFHPSGGAARGRHHRGWLD